MRDFGRPGVWLGIWCVGWLLCIVLSLSSPVSIGIDIDNGDKLGHFLAYATLSAWSVMLFAKRPAQLLAAAALVSLGVAMELAQAQFTVDRMMDARDALANAIGVAVGHGVAFTRARGWLQALDARLFG